MITTITNVPPQIITHLSNILLLSYPEHVLFILKNKIIPNAKKKIRSCDHGKQREFDKLLNEFREVYVRKKIEEDEYKEKTKAAIEKRSCMPNSSQTVRFKRMDTGK